jgi:hypothetical protein
MNIVIHDMSVTDHNYLKFKEDSIYNIGAIDPNALTWVLNAIDILKWSNQVLNSILTLGL